jgi:hypothetical protein
MLPTTLTENYLSYYWLAKIGIDPTTPASFTINRHFWWHGSLQAVGSAAPSDMSPVRLRQFYQARCLQAVAPS